VPAQVGNTAPRDLDARKRSQCTSEARGQYQGSVSKTDGYTRALRTSIVNSQKRQIAFGLKLSCFLSLNLVRAKGLCSERSLTRVRNLINHILHSVPVANPVCVTCPDQRINACRDYVTELIEE
jgi:hypothetical protein